MRLSQVLLMVGLCVAGILALLHNTVYQPALATGDHGRDLYAFAATLHGETPYRDYWWVYGPLMPYYYAAWMKVCGITIPAALWGKLACNIAAGIFFFLALRLFIPIIPAFLGTLWFWLFRPEFFFTYNHIGGIAALLAETYFLCAYFRTGNITKLYGALAAVTLLCLIKINFGVAGWVMMGVGVAVSDALESRRLTKDKQVWIIGACCTVPVIVALAYGAMTADLPLYALRQCFPFMSADHPHNAPPIESLKLLAYAIWHNINFNWPNRLFALLIALSVGQTVRLMRRGQVTGAERRQMLLTFGFLAVFYGITLTEFLLSGVLYRSYWTAPFSLLLIFLLIGTAFRPADRLVRLLLYGALLIILTLRFSQQIDTANYLRTNGHSLGGPRGGVTTGNPLPWFDTVQNTVNYLQRHLEPDETFFALPYDPLYLYLTGRPSPTRQLIFFEHINIPPEQEDAVIAELESAGVRYVLLSNRMDSPERGLGTFGTTYCPKLFAYVFDNFEPVFRTGDWQSAPGWNGAHGTMILQRKAKSGDTYRIPNS